MIRLSCVTASRRPAGSSVASATVARAFALVHALPRHGTAPDVGDDAPAWSLFDDAVELQRAMTAQVRNNVKANYGIEIAGEGEGVPTGHDTR